MSHPFRRLGSVIPARLERSDRDFQTFSEDGEINETDTSTVFGIFLIISYFQFSYARDGAQENWMSFIIWEIQKTPQLR